MPDAYVEPRSSGPVTRLINAIRNRRATKRVLREARVFLFTDRQFLSPAILVDESEGGALLWAPTPRALTAARFMLDHTTGEVRTLHMVWRAGKRGGFRYLATRRLDVFTPEAEVEHVRQFWSKMASVSFH